jgi:hypothetical protein
VCGAALSNQIICGLQENRLPAPQMIPLRGIRFTPFHIGVQVFFSIFCTSLSP